MAETARRGSGPGSRGWGAAGAAALAAVLGLGLAAPSGAQEGIPIPAPAVEAPVAGQSQVAVLAGGCFWGVQGVFQRVDGVDQCRIGLCRRRGEDCTV